MSDIFISYGREDRDTASDLAAALEGGGLTVWWDRELKGGTEFATAIERELLDARTVIVLWSRDSVKSGFVRDESTRALEMGKLLPVRIEEVALPLGFGQIHTLDLIDWEGDATDGSLQHLLHEVRTRLGQASQPPLPEGRRIRWKRSRRLLVIGAAVLVAVVGGFAAYQWQQSEKADRNFRAGLEQQFAREPNLESARNFFLDAIALRPGHARSSFYLAHVYAQLGQPALALASFERALATRTGLDAAQESEARARVAALSPAAEPTAIARAPTSSGVVPQVSIGLGDKPPAKAMAPSPSPVTVPALKPETVAARPPQVPPSIETRRKAEDLVDKMFGTSSEERIAATTSLVTSPELLSDAVPIAVDTALSQLLSNVAPGLTRDETRLLREASKDPDIAAIGDLMTNESRSGVINTLVLLQAALPGTLSVNRASIEHLLSVARRIGPLTSIQVGKVQVLLDASASRRPVAFIQIANEAQRPIAESLAVRLRAAGYDAPGIENVGTRAPDQSSVRIHGKSERGFARWIAKVVGDADGEAVAVQTLRNANPKVDTFEIWFDRDLCTPGRSAPKCAR